MQYKASDLTIWLIANNNCFFSFPEIPLNISDYQFTLFIYELNSVLIIL
jgi:hypothetical protein